MTFRARVTAITPLENIDIAWRHSGEGLGGEVFRGIVGEDLKIGQWSPPVEVVSLVLQGRYSGTLFLTITTGQGGKYQTVNGDDRVTRRVLVGASQDIQIGLSFAFAISRSSGSPSSACTAAPSGW